MATLFTLPTELLFCIADDLEEPTECFNLAITCKSAWQILAYKIEDHRKLFAQYSSVTLSGEGDTIWELFHTYLHNNRIAKYIRKFSITAERQRYFDQAMWYYEQMSTPTVLLPPDYLAEFREKLEECSDLLAPVGRDRGQSYFLGHNDPAEVMRKGSDGPLLAIFVTFLQKLKRLEYSVSGESEWMERVLMNIGSRYMDPNSRHFTAQELPFQHLTHVTVSHWDSEGQADWLWCPFFICIPSVQTFTGFMLGGGEDDFDPVWGDVHLQAERARSNFHRGSIFPRYSVDTLTLANSNFHKGILPRYSVDTLTLGNSNFHKGILRKIFSYADTMKTFQYSYGGYNVGDYEFDARAIIDLLHQQPALKELEHLAVVDYEEEVMYDTPDPLEVSLAEFHKLKSLQCNLGTLIPYKAADDGEGERDEDELDHSDKKRGFDITTILPKSLEALHLHVTRPSKPIDDQILLDVVKNKAENFPNLRQFYLACHVCRYSTPALQPSKICRCQEVKEMCKESGLVFEPLAPVDYSVCGTQNMY